MTEPELSYRIKDLEVNRVEINTALSRAMLTDVVGDMDADLDGCSIKMVARLSKQNMTVQCDGSLQGVLTLPCHRCLSKARVPIEIPVHTIFVPQPKVPVEDRTVDPEADDLDFAHHDGEVVALAPVVREYIILAIPLRILCKDDCLGLCPQCGTDRNAAVCSCLPPPAMGPLAALKNVKL